MTVDPELLAKLAALLEGPRTPAPAEVMREPGMNYRSDLTLEKHHAAVACDLGELRRYIATLSEEVRRVADRSEQVYSWLAQLRNDLIWAAEHKERVSKAMKVRDGETEGVMAAEPGAADAK